MIAAAFSRQDSLSLLRFIRTPKRLLLGVFAALAVVATPLAGGNALLNLAVAVALAVAIDFVATAVKGDKAAFPDGAILTGMIVAFLISPFEPTSTVVIAVTAALVSREVLRTKWSNVFNPAAVALVVSGYFAGASQSWWGALPDLGIAGALVVLALGVLIADRVNKLPMVTLFLGTYFGLCTVAALFGLGSEVAGIFRAPDVHAALFFALFMLDDPPTSPVRYEDQVVYGVIVATLAYLLLMTVGVVYYLPLALLGGNAWESGRRLYAASSRKRSAVA